MAVIGIATYIEETQSIITEIDVLHATGMECAIQKHMVDLKKMSDQVGANDMAAQAENIKSFLIENDKDLALLHIQTRLDGFIKRLREAFFAYRAANEK